MKLITRLIALLKLDKIVKKIIGDSAWLLAANFVTGICGIGQITLLTRLIGPNGIGIIGLFIAGSSLLQGLLTLRSAETILTFATKLNVDGNRTKSNEVITYCFVLDILSAILSYCILILLSNIFIRQFNIDPIYKSSFIIYCLVIILTSPIVAGNALLRLRGLFKLNLIVTTISSLTRLVLTLFLYMASATLQSVIWIYVLGSFIEGTLIFYFSLKGYGILRHPKVLKSIINTIKDKELVSFQFQGYLKGIIKAFTRYVDILIIGFISSLPAQVGFYRVGKQIINYIQLPVDSIAAAIYPEFGRLWYSKRYKDLRTTVFKLTAVFSIFAITVFFATILFSKEIVSTLFGNEFAGSEAIVNIMIFSGIIGILMTPLYCLPQMTGNAKAPLLALTMAIVGQIIALIILAPHYQAIGAAWSNVVYMSVWAICILPTIIAILKKHE